MSKSINTVTISGNLGRDPETKAFPSGASVTEFTIAVSDYFKPKDSEGKELTYWIRCKCWGKLGERLADWCKKGDSLMVSGRLVQEEWEQDGKKQSKTMVNVENFVPGRKKIDAASREVHQGAQRKAPAPDPDLDAEGDDIPF